MLSAVVRKALGPVLMGEGLRKSQLNPGGGGRVRSGGGVWRVRILCRRKRLCPVGGKLGDFMELKVTLCGGSAARGRIRWVVAGEGAD